MKKFILAILAIFFVVFGNSIVGTWVSDIDEYYVVFEEGGKGYWLGFSEPDCPAEVGCEGKWEKYEFTYSVNGNEITMFPRGEAPFIFIYNGRDVFVIELEGERPETFTRTENPTAINPKQNAQTQSNFQISRNSNSLHLNFADNSLKRIEIVNLQGRILNSQSFSAKTQSVDISNLSRGVFVLRVFEGGGVGVVRFVRE